MDENHLRQLASSLGECSNIVSQILGAGNSAAQQPTSNPTSTVGNNTIANAVVRARSMMQRSTSAGLCSRLSQRERLRSSTSSSSASALSINKAKKAKTNQEQSKPFEFALVFFENEEEFMINNTNVALRGFVNLANSDGEKNIRSKIGEAIRIKYPLVSNTDFEFLRANRRKLSIPVTCEEYTYKQVKLLCGQGAIYIKIKDGFDFLLGDDINDKTLSDDEVILNIPAYPPSEAEKNSPVVTETQSLPPCESGGTHSVAPLESPTVAAITTDQDAAVSKRPIESADVDALANHVVEYCKEHDIHNPTEILRYAQKVLVCGRALRVEDISQVSEGPTNFIFVDRDNLLTTAFDEIKSLKETLHKTLEVQFYCEEAEDYGGPRREFFRLIQREICEKYFERGLKHHLSEDYYIIGIILGLSILQDGKLPQFLGEDVITEVFDASAEKSSETPTCLDELRLGLHRVGIYQIGSQMPTFLHLFRPGPKGLTFKFMCQLLRPEFSEEGSNNRIYENAVYTMFQKYLREVASGRRNGLTLESILEFVTGADEEPVLGFGMPPSLAFHEVQKSFVPSANTCVSCLRLPRPTHDTPLPESNNLFELYDLAFSSTFFGKK